MEKMKPLAILMKYFGYRAPEYRGVDPETGQTFSAIKDFATEAKALSPADKDELVQGAARELGVAVDVG